ncbi:MAG: type I-G CRISPR-associated protein Csb2 [Planctomycetaceae bacterium]
MQRVLLIAVRFHDSRYYGAGDWPPSSARLFQALVAGIGQDGPLDDDTSKPLEWLETLAPPVIAAAHMTFGMTIPMHFVPNNDLDAHGGQASKLGKTRTAFKVWKPKLFDQETEFLYAWQFDDTDASLSNAKRICEYAERLYQLGRGVDQAWAFGEVIESREFENRVLAYPGVVYRPTGGQQGIELLRPQRGSLKTLKDRHRMKSQRFKAQRQGKSVKLQFARIPEPQFASATYNSPPSRQIFELRSRTSQASLVAWPLSRVGILVLAIRDRAVVRLKAALPEQESQIEKCLVGRKADGRDDAPKTARVRILPLPSIGHDHADHAIRRILVEVPAECLLRSEDVFWAFSGADHVDSDGKPHFVLTSGAEESMQRWYGVTGPAYGRWRTITPAALPEIAKRRRIEPTRRAAEAKRGAERASEQQRAAIEVIQALRHADLPTDVGAIRVQREPFEANGQRVEMFAPGTRFQKERLWHVELTFTAPLSGPLIFGDGRYCGLGLMAPVPIEKPSKRGP